MLTPAGLIHLLYTPDLTEAGIAYACRSLPHTYDRMGGDRFHRLRRIVSGKAVELAFRRYLNDRGVPYDNLGDTPFTDPDNYDISLGGRRCDIKSFLFLEKDRIRRLKRDPGYLLQAAALVPTDQAAASHFTEQDLYIFAFVTALVTRSAADLERAQDAGQPAYLIYPFPSAWTNPARWRSLGPLELSSEKAPPLRVEIGGQAQDRSFQTEQITLLAGQPVQADQEFYSLAYLHLSRQFNGQIRVSSPGLNAAQVISAANWGNIWVYGMEIVLAGYMLRGEFLRRSQQLPAGSRVLQYARTRTANLSLPVEELHPLEDLFESARRWKLGWQKA